MEADFQILVSIYNPNMLDAKIESGTAILSHKHTPVCWEVSRCTYFYQR